MVVHAAVLVLVLFLCYSGCYYGDVPALFLSYEHAQPSLLVNFSIFLATWSDGAWRHTATARDDPRYFFRRTWVRHNTGWHVTIRDQSRLACVRLEVWRLLCVMRRAAPTQRRRSNPPWRRLFTCGASACRHGHIDFTPPRHGKDMARIDYHREPQVRKSGVMDGGVRSSVLGGELW